MRTSAEWGRSRYWLCHFLHSRHERTRIDWSVPPRPIPGLAVTLADWLNDQQQAANDDHRWMAAEVVRRCADDPAFVQAVRLWLKEREYHGQLLARLRRHLREQAIEAPPETPSVTMTPVLGRQLGVRFQWSRMLLADLLAQGLWPQIARLPGNAALAAVSRQLQTDRAAHLSFIAERLTMEFADFNFIRRNLRRWRLRIMFGISLGLTLARQAAMIRACGWSRTAYALDRWRAFRALLERMVPYHRDALLTTLLSQQREPYAKPLGLP